MIVVNEVTHRHMRRIVRVADLAEAVDQNYAAGSLDAIVFEISHGKRSGGLRVTAILQIIDGALG